MSKITLILGGVRSGKSEWVVKKVYEKFGENVIFIATSLVRDEEMKERIENHKKRRPSSWKVIEEPFHPEKIFEEKKDFKGGIILDCLTVWVSNLLEKKENVEKRLEKLSEVLIESRGEIYLISNEVGMGIVPPYPSGRKFRDILGRLNQRIAKLSDEVYFMIAGIPYKIK